MATCRCACADVRGLPARVRRYAASGAQRWCVEMDGHRPACAKAARGTESGSQAGSFTAFFFFGLVPGSCLVSGRPPAQSSRVLLAGFLPGLLAGLLPDRRGWTRRRVAAAGRRGSWAVPAGIWARFGAPALRIPGGQRPLAGGTGHGMAGCGEFRDLFLPLKHVNRRCRGISLSRADPERPVRYGDCGNDGDDGDCGNGGDDGDAR